MLECWDDRGVRCGVNERGKICNKKSIVIL